MAEDRRRRKVWGGEVDLGAVSTQKERTHKPGQTTEGLHTDTGKRGAPARGGAPAFRSGEDESDTGDKREQVTSETER